jgi:hypothetical protein
MHVTKFSAGTSPDCCASSWAWEMVVALSAMLVQVVSAAHAST